MWKDYLLKDIDELSHQATKFNTPVKADNINKDIENLNLELNTVPDTSDYPISPAIGNDMDA
jgi:hypothetical protein